MQEQETEREFFIDNLLVRIYFILEMIWWTGLTPWEFEFSFPGSRISTFLEPRSKSKAQSAMALLERLDLISQRVFIKSFSKSQFPLKIVNPLFTITIIKNTLTDLCGN